LNFARGRGEEENAASKLSRSLKFSVLFSFAITQHSGVDHRVPKEIWAISLIAAHLAIRRMGNGLIKIAVVED